MPDVAEASKAVHALARSAQAEWGLEEASLALYLQGENAVFRVESKQGDVYALRVHREGYHDLAELESEHVWTTELARAGLRVPETVSTLDGRAYATVEFPRAASASDSGRDVAARHVGLVKWIAGTPLSQFIDAAKDPTEISGCFEELGALMAGFHAFTSTWTPPGDFRRHAWDTDGLFGEAPFWGRFWEIEAATDNERSRLLALRNLLIERLSTLDRGPEAYGMIHADLHSDNVLVEGDRLTAIDFDDAGFGWYVYDIGLALYSELDAFHAKKPRFEVARDALLRGYRAKRSLSAEELDLVPLFILVRALIMLRWAEDRPEAGMAESVPFLKKLAFEQAEELGLK